MVKFIFYKSRNSSWENKPNVCFTSTNCNIFSLNLYENTFQNMKMKSKVIDYMKNIQQKRSHEINLFE